MNFRSNHFEGNDGFLMMQPQADCWRLQRMLNGPESLAPPTESASAHFLQSKNFYLSINDYWKLYSKYNKLIFLLLFSNLIDILLSQWNKLLESKKQWDTSFGKQKKTGKCSSATSLHGSDQPHRNDWFVPMADRMIHEHLNNNIGSPKLQQLTFWNNKRLYTFILILYIDTIMPAYTSR